MKYLFLLLLFVPNAKAQEAGRIEELEIEIDRVTATVDSLSLYLQGLRSEKNVLISQIAKDKYKGSDDLTVMLGPSGFIYSDPDVLIGGEKRPGLRGKLGEYKGLKVYFSGEDGTNGWVGVNSFRFLEDPTEYLASVEVSRMVREYLLGVERKWKQSLLDQAAEQKRLETQRVAEQKSLEKKEEVLEARRKLVARGVFLIVTQIKHRVNSAGGVEPIIDFQNLIAKRIKYSTFFMTAYNPVGDPVGAEYELNLKLIGPIAEGASAHYDFASDPPFYNGITHCLELLKVEVEYMDGTFYTMLNDLITTRLKRSSYNTKGECQNI